MPAGSELGMSSEVDLRPSDGRREEGETAMPHRSDWIFGLLGVVIDVSALEQGKGKLEMDLAWLAESTAEINVMAALDLTAQLPANSSLRVAEHVELQAIRSRHTGDTQVIRCTRRQQAIWK